MKGISAILIIYNEEEALLSRCIESMNKCVNEIIVVHDGPAPKGIKSFLSKYNVRFFEQEHRGYMEAYLVFALKKCKYDWVLRIDADEFLTRKLADNIQRAITNKDYDSYSFLWPMYSQNRERTKNGPYKRILFRKSKISYIDLIHLNFICDGKNLDLDYKLCHRPKYDNFSWKNFRTKWMRWADIEANSYFRDFKTIDKYNYKAKSWPKEIELTLKYPIISLIIYPPYSFVINTYRVILKNPYMVIVNYYYALYRAAVCWKIIKIKYFGKNNKSR